MGVSNKKLGSDFEQQMCDVLASIGYWVHFIAPDVRGAQPFDIVAVKNGNAMAIDCKTSATHIFNVRRIEDNQHMAFQKWIRCGNNVPYIAILYDDNLYMIEYTKFNSCKSINLKDEEVNIWFREFSKLVKEVREK